MSRNSVLKIAVTVIAATALSCASGVTKTSLDKPKFGTVAYDVTINGNTVGSCVVKIEDSGSGRFSTTTTNILNMSGVEMTTVEKITESYGFDPIETEFTNTIKKGGFVSRTTFSAKASGNEIITNDDGEEGKIVPSGKFYFSENVITAMILKAGLKRGSSAKANIYEPYLSPEKTIEIASEIKGKKTVEYAGKNVELTECSTITSGKVEITSYLESDGTPDVIEISMMGTKMRMVRVK